MSVTDLELDRRSTTDPTAAGNRPKQRSGSGPLLVLGVVSVFCYLALVAFLMATKSYDIWGAYLYGPLFYLVGFMMLRSFLSRVETDLFVHRVMYLALGLKLVAGVLRYYTALWFLGIGDAWAYHDYGSSIAEEFRSFVFGGPNYQAALPDLLGTEFIRLLTGIVYTVMGTTRLGGYLAFSFMSFWGLYLFYRAFRIALPDGERRRYAVILFLLPSTVFWPSSIGKEAWMTAVLGLSCYGVARVLTSARGGYVSTALGLAGMMVVRPHVAAIFAAGVAVAMILRRSSGGVAGTGKKMIGLALVAIAGGILIGQLQSFFDFQDGLNVTGVLEETSRRSTTGGSAYAPVVPTTPLQMPWSIITVLFRPFVFEAGGAAGLVTASEGMLLMIIVAASFARLVRLPKAIVTYPYVALAAIFLLLFCFAFSSLGNFGILARQRTQVFPFLAVLLCVPVKSFLKTKSDVISEALARKNVGAS